MYIEKQALIELYKDFMDKMDNDIVIAGEFKGQVEDDYLEGIHTGIRAAQNIFRQSYKRAFKN